MSYRQGQKYVQNFGIRTVKDLLQWLKSDERPDNFPPDPHIVWDKSWQSTQDFLQIKWMSFQEARAYVQWGGVTNKREYYELRESEGLMNKLPPNPAVIYTPYWKGWDDFLWDMELSNEKLRDEEFSDRELKGIKWGDRDWLDRERIDAR